MTISFNGGSTPTDVKFNGTSVTEVQFNGTTVWEAQQEFTIVCNTKGTGSWSTVGFASAEAETTGLITSSSVSPLIGAPLDNSPYAMTEIMLIADYTDTGSGNSWGYIEIEGPENNLTDIFTSMIITGDFVDIGVGEKTFLSSAFVSVSYTGGNNIYRTSEGDSFKYRLKGSNEAYTVVFTR